MSSPGAQSQASKQLWNRLVNVGLTVTGAAAVTSILLWLFQDSADAAANEPDRNARQNGAAPPRRLGGGSGAAGKESHGPVKAAMVREKEEQERAVEHPLASRNYVKVGDGSRLFPDYIAGLLALSKLASQTQSGTGYVNNFGELVLIVTKPEHVRKTLSTNTAHALGGMGPASAAYFGEKVLFILEGKEWRDLRNVMRMSFLPHKLPMLEADVASVAFDLSNSLRQHMDGDKALDMHLVLSLYHLSAIGRSAFNFDLHCLEDIGKGGNEITESFEYLLQELPRRAYSQDASVREDYETPNEDNKKWKHHASTVRNVINGVVEARLAARAKGEGVREDLLEAMIRSYEKELGGTLSAQALVDALGDNLVEILFAGYNTSAATMAIALYYLAKNPEWHAKVQKEVDSALADQAIGKGVELFKLPLCRAVFYEALRLVPPAPLVYRSITKAYELEPGLEVPQGTAVWIPALFLHLDPETWGKDAAIFNPERWLRKDFRPHPPGAFVPFSDGPRDCIGKHFAELESVTALAVLLKNFNFRIPVEYEFNPTFTGFGLRPFDTHTKSVCMNLIVEDRVMTSEHMYDWSPERPQRTKAATTDAVRNVDELDLDSVVKAQTPGKISFTPLANDTK